MKKFLIALFITLILVTGCGKEDSKDDEVNKSNIQQEQENINNYENNQSNNEENIIKENETPVNKIDANDSNNQNQAQQPTIDNKDEITTSESSKLGLNEYISMRDNQIHKYTFTYSDKETCERKADGDAYDIVYKLRPYSVFDCDQIKDANGKILWGAYFFEHADEDSIFYY